MINSELAQAFERAADLLEIDGADAFRVNSFRKAARSIHDSTEDIASVIAASGTVSLPGVGKSTLERIKQYLVGRTFDTLAELERKFPSGLPRLLEIPGLGPKKVAAIYHTLQVKDLAELKRAIADGRLATLPGFGQASIRKIADGIDFLERTAGRAAAGEALPIAEALAAHVRAMPGVEQAAVAGSLRRGAETVGDVDLLCIADDGESVTHAFCRLTDVRRVLAEGGTKASVTVLIEGQRELQVDLRVVPRGSFGAALQYFTGSKAHNVRLRELASRRGLRLNEYGLYEGETQVAGTSEEEIYESLGLVCPPPELREDRGEFAAGVSYKQLLSLEHIRGDLHMHTVASDGRFTAEEMAAAAGARGYEYIAICDHSKSSVIANGLSVERMEQQIAFLRRLGNRLDGIALLVGCECDILPDGSLDYPDDILAQCDWVVASIHSAMGPGGSGKLSPTERTIAAIENRYVCAIGHPTGRLINRRPAMELDMGRIVELAASNGTCLEVNASWQRLDLKDQHARQALEAGVLLTINTDAHHVDQLDGIRFGVATARRAGALKDQVINTMSLAELRARVAVKRDRR